MFENIGIIIDVVALGALLAGIIWRIIGIVRWAQDNSLSSCKSSGKFRFYKNLYDYPDTVFPVIFSCLLAVGLTIGGFIITKNIIYDNIFNPSTTLVYLVSALIGHILAFLIAWRGVVCFYYSLIFFTVLIFFLE